MTVEEIIDAIAEWEKIRNTDDALRYIKSLPGFSITRKEYNDWEQLIGTHTPHVNKFYFYLGAHDNRLNLFLFSIDLKCIRDERDRDKIIVCSRSENGNQIPPGEAEVRITRWRNQNKLWFDRVRPIGNVVKCFWGKNDLASLFHDEHPEAEGAIFYLGLTQNGSNEPDGYGYVELIISNDTKKAYYDVTKPRPPF